jgi:hypothetical protein
MFGGERDRVVCWFLGLCLDEVHFVDHKKWAGCVDVFHNRQSLPWIRKLVPCRSWRNLEFYRS